MMAAPGEQERFAATLPVAVLELVLSHHAGEPATLCAAACVSRAWCAAAAQPRLWRSLLFEPEASPWGLRDCRVLRRLTDARLAALVARADGALERLRLDGVAARFDSRAFHTVTAGGVVAALRGNVPLRELRVRGVRSDGATYTALRALVARRSALDVADGATCTCGGCARAADASKNPPCGGRLCNADTDLVCEDCITYCCVRCRPHLLLLPCCAVCELCGGGDADTLRLCDRCSVKNGYAPPYPAFCDACSATCANCEARTRCANCWQISCEECGNSFCEECWLGCGAVDFCHACYTSLCDGCEQKARRSGAGFSWCSGCCGHTFCGHCLTAKGAADARGKQDLYCDECLQNEDDSSSDEEA